MSDSDSEYPPDESYDFIIFKKQNKEYDNIYKQFKHWCDCKNAKFVSESVFLSYIMENSKTLEYSMLWDLYSKLKNLLIIKDGVDVRKYFKVIQFLKRQSMNNATNKLFTQNQIKTFLKEANDEEYLLFKVIMIMCISGSMTQTELMKITVNDVKECDDGLFVLIRNNDGSIDRNFTITDIDYLRSYYTYIAIRSSIQEYPQLFLRYQLGNCYPETITINTIIRTPYEIAKYLNLPKKKLFSGYYFKITSSKSSNEDESEPDDSEQLKVSKSLNYCRLCFKPSKSLNFLSTIHLSYASFILPEIDLTQGKIPQVCRECLVGLEFTFKFKKKCLKANINSKVNSDIKLEDESKNVTEVCKIKEEVEEGDYEVSASAEDLSTIIKQEKTDEEYKEMDVEMNCSINETQLDNEDVEEKGEIKCSYCDKDFYLKSALRFHVMTIHHTKPSCNECGKRFYTEAKLKKHKRGHDMRKYVVKKSK